MGVVGSEREEERMEWSFKTIAIRSREDSLGGGNRGDEGCGGSACTSVDVHNCGSLC